jgi:hypothetical protein
MLLPACGQQGAERGDAASEPETAQTAEQAAAAIEVSETALAVLAKADAFDGAADHVVSRCPSCALAMEGSAEHTLQVGDYELHFCSDHCRGTFAEGAETALLAMSVPDAEVPPAEGNP